MQTRHHRYAQTYTSNFNVIDVDQTMDHLLTGQTYKIDPSDLQNGRIYEVTGCNKVDFGSGTFDEIVFIADCPIQFSNGAIFEDAVIITSATGSRSMYAPNGLVLGEVDNCSPGGGVVLVTSGDFEVASGLEMHGAQIIARGNVDFTANADGLKGASIIAGGGIDSESNMNFAFCGTGIEHFFMAEYFRLAG